jgi:hypothetical protein
MTQALPTPSMRRLRLSPTLSSYIARQYATWFFGFLFGLIGVIVLVSVVDLLDRLAWPARKCRSPWSSRWSCSSFRS